MNDKGANLRNDRITRRALIGSGVAAGLFVGQASASRAGVAAGGTLRIAAEGPIGVSRGRLSVASALATTGTVFETLTELAADGTLAGDLAETWRSDSSARIWTFRLRNGAGHTDQTHLTAEDIAESLDVLRTEGGLAAALLADIRSVKAVDRLTLRISLWHPNPGFPLFLAEPGLGIGREGAKGSGAFDFGLSRSGARAVLKRRTSDGASSAFDRIEVLAADSAAERAELLAIGRVDLAVDLAKDALPDLLRKGRVRLVREVGAIETVLRADGPDARIARKDCLRAAEMLGGAEDVGAEEARRLVSSLSGGATKTRLTVLERSRPASENVSRTLALPMQDPAAAKTYLASLGTWRVAQDPNERARAESALDALSAEIVIARRDRVSFASNRLRHGPRVGSAWGLDNARVAQRWWRA